MVSVILPTFNRLQFLPSAIRSVLAQTFRDWELLVVDDGSTDETPRLQKEFKDPRIHWLRTGNGGVSRARNWGFGQARYDWIAFLDSDDSWFPRKLQRQMETLEEDPRYRVIYTNEVWIRNGTRVNQAGKHAKYSGWIFRNSLPLCIISPSSIVTHRSVLEESGIFDESFPVCEDYELWLRITARHPVRFLDENLITKTGGHSDQLSHSRWGLDRYRVRALLKLQVSALLSPQQRRWVAAEILKKSRVLATGFQNRGKPAEAERYSRLASMWEEWAASPGQ